MSRSLACGTMGTSAVREQRFQSCSKQGDAAGTAEPDRLMQASGAYITREKSAAQLRTAQAQPCRPSKPFLHSQIKTKPARSAQMQQTVRVFQQLRQQESNLRWGSQSPLPYRLAMAHHGKYYSILRFVSQDVRSVFLPAKGVRSPSASLPPGADRVPRIRFFAREIEYF